MATATATWNFWANPPTWQALVDFGTTTSITYSKDATDVAAKFVCTTKNLAGVTEEAVSATRTDTWETIFGIPAGSTVTAYQVTAWTRKLVANTQLSAIAINIGLIKASTLGWVSEGSTNSASVNLGGTSTATDATYTAQTAGGSRTVDALFQPSNSAVNLELDCRLSTTNLGGVASVDVRMQTVTITITYTPGASSFKPGYATGATRVLGTGVF